MLVHRQQVTEFNAISNLHCNTSIKQTICIQYRLFYNSSNYPTAKSKISVDKAACQNTLTRKTLWHKCRIWIFTDKKSVVFTDIPDPKSPHHLCKNHSGQQTLAQTQGSKSRGKIKWFEISGILFVLLNLLKHSFKRSLKYPIVRIASKIQLLLKMG